MFYVYAVFFILGILCSVLAIAAENGGATLLSIVLILISGSLIISGAESLPDQSDLVIERSIEEGFAYYHPQTGEIVWDDTGVRYVVTGEKDLKGEER